MKRLRIFVIGMVGLLATAAAANAEHIRATLTGYEEVPVVSTVARGEFRGTISDDGQSISYSLTYRGLQGTVTQGHIHIAQLGVNGSIVIWLCQTGTNVDPTGLSPQCPQQGSVDGMITAANVIAGSTASQQLNAGDLSGAITAMRAGAAYVNIHTSPLSGGGEIRGQIRIIAR